MFLIMFWSSGCGVPGIRFTDSRLGYFCIPYRAKTPVWIESLWENSEDVKSMCVPKEI